MKKLLQILLITLILQPITFANSAEVHPAVGINENKTFNNIDYTIKVYPTWNSSILYVQTYSNYIDIDYLFYCNEGLFKIHRILENPYSYNNDPIFDITYANLIKPIYEYVCEYK